MLILQTTFKPLLLKGVGGGGVKSVSIVTVNSKEENSEDFCPNYVGEFGLSKRMRIQIKLHQGAASFLKLNFKAHLEKPASQQRI